MKQLYQVSVIDSVIPRQRNAKVFVQRYVTYAASTVEAARNVVLGNTVHGADRIIARASDELTISIGSKHYFSHELASITQGCAEFCGSDFSSSAI